MKYRFIPIFLIGFMIILDFQVQVQAEWMISTIAGDGTRGYSGDGGLATAAQLNQPWGIAVDSSGVLYVADFKSHSIRKIDNQGVITTIAGDGRQGYHGDGGSATAAQLNQPRGIALDSNGALYIADAQNHLIRKINRQGIITTIAGNNVAGYCCEGIQATTAQLNYPIDVAIDNANNLYIADKNNHVIRKVDSHGIITTIVGDNTQGNGTRDEGGLATRTQLNSPHAIALDHFGHLYIADYGNHLIRKVDKNGYINTVAGNATQGYSGDGKSATTAQLNFPSGIALDKAGNLYINDTQNYRIRRVDIQGNITTIAGDGTQGYSGDNGIATAAQINTAFYIAVDKREQLYFADTDNYRLRKIDLSLGMRIRNDSGQP
ncbi:MAG: hypothetical protein KAI83_10270 [Thiomargarita sp.]|nr:hypothetical protein [Thiomargarita sp.]